MAAAAATAFRARAFKAFRRGKLFVCALSGGSTPTSMYRELNVQQSTEPFPTGFWESVHFFWGDERDVPPDHPESNYRVAREMLLNWVALPESNIHRILSERGGAIKAAEEYEAELRRFFSLTGKEIPRFDLIYLGIGADGHTASIFPLSSVVHETDRLVSALWVEKLNAFRITLTLPVINNAACVIFLVTGLEKAEAVRQVLGGHQLPECLPAQLVKPRSGELLWLLDRAAASKLSPETGG